MGKHEISYARVERDLYPTPRWITEALLVHVDLTRVTVWEPAAGRGDMVTALRDSSIRVVASDIADHGFSLDAKIDFTTGQVPPAPFQAIITNPPGGTRNTLAERFIEIGLKHLTHGASLLALLLPLDFDSAGRRRRFFAECPWFIGKIVLTRRAVWFERSDGVRAAPKENHAWFLWQWTALKTRTPALILYPPVPDFSCVAPTTHV
jgi:hypothetical protein